MAFISFLSSYKYASSLFLPARLGCAGADLIGGEQVSVADVGGLVVSSLDHGVGGSHADPAAEDHCDTQRAQPAGVDRRRVCARHVARCLHPLYYNTHIAVSLFRRSGYK